MPARRHGTLTVLLAALALGLPAAAQAAAPTCSPAAARAEGSGVATATFAVPTCLDANGDAVTPDIVAQPTAGLLSAGGDGFVYRSRAETGTLDRVGFQATAGGETSQTLWVQLGVRTLPRPSCAALAPLTARPGRTARAVLACVDGDPLGGGFSTAVDHRPAPAVGSVDEAQLATGVIRFTAAPAPPQDPGQDVLTLRVANAAGPSELVTQPLVVDSRYNTAPECLSGSRGVQPEDTVEIALRCSDADGDALTYAVDPPDLGTVGPVTPGSGRRPPSVRYTAPEDGASVLLRFTATDGSATAEGGHTIAVDEALTNVAPICAAATARTVRDRAITVPLRCTDPEGGPVVLTARAAGATLGTVTGPDDADWDGASFGFIPTAGQTGAGAFRVDARDDQGATTTLDVTVRIDPPDRPVCPVPPGGLAVRPGRTLTGTLACRNTASFLPGASPGGSVTISPAGAWSFTAGATAHPAGGFTVTPRNAAGVAGDPVEVAIAVDPDHNTAPACAGTAPTPGPRLHERVRLDVVCADAEGDPFTVAPTAADRGTVDVGGTGAATTVGFTATAEGAGGATLRATDARGAGGDLRLDLTVRPESANTAPDCAVPAPVTAYEGRPVTLRVLAGCTDADRDPLRAELPADPPLHGVLDPAGAGEWTYTPAAGAGGADPLAFAVTDEREAVTRTFAITVVAGPETLLDGERPADPTAATTATLRFGSPNVTAPTFQCRLDGGAWTGCTSPWTRTGLTDGTHVAEVRALDGATPDGTPASHTWTVDTVAPAAPVLTTVPAARVGGGPVTVAWTLGEGSARCTLDGVATACASPLTLTDLAAGTHRLVVAARDAAGNLGPAPEVVFEVVRTGPGRPVMTGKPLAVTNRATLTFGATGTAASWECRTDAGAWEPCMLPVTVGGLADGAHAFAIRGVDELGNAGPADTTGWTQDTVAPAAPAVTGVPAGVVAVRSVTPVFGTDPDVARHTCTLDGTERACASGQTFTGLADGGHTLVVEAVDAAGNRAAAPGLTWTVDATPPGAPVVTDRPPALTGPGPVTFGYGAADATGYECRLDGAPWRACPPPRTLGEVTDGEHEFAVRAVDAAGNRSGPALVVWRRDAAASTGTGTTLSASGVTVTSPVAGPLALLGGRAAPGLAGWAAMAPGVLVGAPVASVAAPLRLDVTVPDGADADATGVVLGGTLVPACTGPGATPDPCVAARGGRTITVRATAPGTVSLHRALPEAPAPVPADPAPAVPAVPAAGGGAPTVAPGARDRTPPTVAPTTGKRVRLARALRRGVPVTLGCSEACAGQVLATVDGRTARRLRLARRATPTVVAGATGAGTVTLRFSAAAARRLAGRRSVRLTLRIAVADRAGNPATARLSLTLRR